MRAWRAVIGMGCIAVWGGVCGCAGGLSPEPLGDPGEVRVTPQGFRSGLVYPRREAGQTSRFAVESGEHEDAVIVRIIKASESDADFMVREQVKEDGQVISERFVQVGADGSLVMPRMHNTKRGRITRFEPALTLAPASLVQGEPYEQKVKVEVADLDNPDDIQERGTGTSTITYLGMERIRTPAGEFEAHLVRSKLTTEFTAAKAERVTDRWYAADVGLVGESYEEKISVMGFVVETKRRSMRRIQSP